MNFVKLTKEKLDLNAISELVVHESCGAVSFFVGTTRDNFEDKVVLSLEYEAYDLMALKALTKICDEIRAKWDDTKHIAIYHRLGVVPVKESSVIIAISSPHRQNSLDAIQYAIDELKKSVPIWKKEIYGGNFEAYQSVTPRKRRKREKSQLNFDICCPINNDIFVSKDLLQIRADEAEIKRRVNCFIERKREEIDINNVQDFITNADEDSTCARVNSTVYRAKGANTHLKIHRVKNEFGPQTINYTNALDKLMENPSPIKIKADPDAITPVADIPRGVNERIVNAEKFLNLSEAVPTTKTVFERLKNIENRILYLEALSPEYNHFLDKSLKKVENIVSATEFRTEKKKTYSVNELDELMKKLEENKK